MGKLTGLCPIMASQQFVQGVLKTLGTLWEHYRQTLGTLWEHYRQLLP